MNIIDAAYHGNLRSLKRALQNGADINTRTEANDDTPLIYAAYKNHLSVVRFLIENGADVSIVNASGHTALSLAKSYQYTDVVKLLEEAARKPQESWRRMGETTVAHHGTYPDINQSLTTVFNFRSRDRVITVRTLGADTPAIGIGPSTSFDALPLVAVQEAFDQFTRLGGQADRDYVLTGHGALDKPRMRLPKS